MGDRDGDGCGEAHKISNGSERTVRVGINTLRGTGEAERRDREEDATCLLVTGLREVGTLCFLHR